MKTNNKKTSGMACFLRVITCLLWLNQVIWEIGLSRYMNSNIRNILIYMQLSQLV